MTDERIHFEDEILPGNSIFQFLRLDGEIGGPVNMAVDGNTTPQRFEYQSPEGIRSIIRRANIVYYCKNPRADKFAGLGNGPLTNGIKVETVAPNGDILKHYLGGDQTIQADGDWGFLSGNDVDTIPEVGVEKVIIVRWTIRRSGNSLRLASKHKFRFTIQDDLSAMDPGPFGILIQGSMFKSDS